MTTEINTFEELDEPAALGSLGWYVGTVSSFPDDCYLHTNGKVYDDCGPRIDDKGNQISTGWFSTQFAAYIQSQVYYIDNGLPYPYVGNIPTVVATASVVTGSKVMEFI